MAKTKLTDKIRDEVAALHRIRKGIKGGDNAAAQIRAVHEIAERLNKKKA